VVRRTLRKAGTEAHAMALAYFTLIGCQETNEVLTWGIDSCAVQIGERLVPAEDGKLCSDSSQI